MERNTDAYQSSFTLFRVTAHAGDSDVIHSSPMWEFDSNTDWGRYHYHDTHVRQVDRCIHRFRLHPGYSILALLCRAEQRLLQSSRAKCDLSSWFGERPDRFDGAWS